MLISHTGFPVRPRMEQGESLAGYISRFQGTNGHWVPRALHDALRVLYRGTPEKVSVAFDIVQAVLGDTVPLDRTWWLGRRLLENRPGGQQRAWPTLQYSPARFCPACLQECGYHFAIWELPLMQACPVHKCSLLANCSKCSLPLSWSEISPHWTCRCGESIVSMRSGEARPGAINVARSLAGSSDVELSGSVQRWVRKLKQGRYCLDEVYTGLEWATKLRDILRERGAQFGEPYHRQRQRAARRVWPGFWESSLICDTQERVAHRLLRTLLRRHRKNRFFLCFIPESDGLVQAIHLVSEPSHSLVQKKVRVVVDQFLARHGVNLPMSSVVLFAPGIPSGQRDVYSKDFAVWWAVLSSHIGDLDPEMLKPGPLLAPHGVTQSSVLIEIQVVEILNLLFDAARQRLDVGRFRELMYWWRIPPALRDISDPNEVLRRVGIHLMTVTNGEVSLVRELILKACKDE
ncbi:MAG: TniQ family protein [Pseudomonadota bacterium]